jgi:hypothetical protein
MRALSFQLQGWKRIMTTIALDPVSKARVMYDILNEPDCRGIGWEGGGSGRSMVRPAAACLHCMSSLALPSSTASRHCVPPSKGPACATVCLPDGADTRCITLIVGAVDDSLMSVSLLQRCATVCCCRPTTTWRSWTRYI